MNVALPTKSPANSSPRRSNSPFAQKVDYSDVSPGGRRDVQVSTHPERRGSTD